VPSIDTKNDIALLTLAACTPTQVLGVPEGPVAHSDESEKATQLLGAFLTTATEGRVAAQGHDHLVLTFAAADAAFAGACLFQQQSGRQALGQSAVRFRVLLDGSPLVNGVTAAAQTTLETAHRLPAQRLFATQRFMDNLPSDLKAKFRSVDPDASSWGTASAQLFESRCAEEECTQVAIPSLRHSEIPRENTLHLRWRGRHLDLETADRPLTLGRGAEADIQIKTEYVSRTHARIAFVHTNYVLFDESTNGTFVRIDEDEEKLVHQEQIVLRGSGVISLGRGIKTGTASLIYFTAT
jgi:adenylate cyclase